MLFQLSQAVVRRMGWGLPVPIINLIVARLRHLKWRFFALATRIDNGTYAPGHAIPSEKTSEQEFGCSRGTVRKAHAMLRAEGIIETVPGRGSYVAPRPPA